MAPLKTLICGGGCAGPALAFWLARIGHRVVVVERFPALRATGAQIDLRAQGIEVAKRMGLLDAIRRKRVHEEGFCLVDSDGRVKATVKPNTSGHGAQSVTSEYEIMRGDLVRILHDATKDDVEYRFGKTVDRYEQVDNRVVAHFSDGSSDTFDLLVGADGQGSRIRGGILPADAPDPYWRMGMHMAYWFIPRTETDANFFTWYHAPGGRLVIRRSHSPTQSQAYFVLRDNSEDLSHLFKASVEKQKEFWTQRYRDAGWEVDRFIEGMQHADNFYSHENLQVRIDTWSKGRVVLLGDAAHCPAVFTGMGTTGSLVGAYVLAGELSRYPHDIAKALENYDTTLRPFVKEIQKTGPSWLMRLGIPETKWGISVLRAVATMLCVLRVPDLIARFSGEDRGGWKLPDYPKLTPHSKPRS
ncbi:monooxygenase [Aspergillus heteromorphus CBS 117.55]|uniref:Monooxygenase n=1 Tax=Aspergillus heteromorphus CBS 117.55 TaxID=1448321 RepID=A0A317V468_9EURO|nr:monooxygenase [Aspergillus heteromorphus CBS 117.55]PWY69073.1 monooxygenase [Aspergillus heteromorphus CBS 117.55]